jgi:tRNA threonylcarbamoyladenosine biosynthesis protein TsaB
VVTADTVEFEVRATTADGHSRWLVAALDVALSGLGLEPRDLDGFAVTLGPGSFTGLRVGMSTVQGLALALGRPCLGVSSLDVLAVSAVGQAPSIVALVDAIRGEVFGAVYDGEGRPRGDPRAGKAADFVKDVDGEVAFVGDGALRYRAEIEARVADAAFPAVDLFLAAALGRQAVEPLQAGQGVPPGELRPLYLRAAHIRKPKR